MSQVTVKDYEIENGVAFLKPVVQNVKYKKDGTIKHTVSNKREGVKSEVYPFEIEDMKKIISWYEQNDLYIHKLVFVISCNLARRIGDILSLKWINFFNPQTGEFRNDILEIKEDKTDKIANPHINSAVKNAVIEYCKNTGCDPTKNNYGEFVFMQLSGTYKGNVLSSAGYLKKLKQAGREVGIGYNIGTHSARKTFGKMTRMLHPNDYDSMELLQTIYNHGDTKTTSRYIGLTKEKVNEYYDDMGTFFTDYIVGSKEFETQSNSIIVSIDINDLREIITKTYDMGIHNREDNNAMVHLGAINEIMSMVDSVKK